VQCRSLAWLEDETRGPDIWRTIQASARLLDPRTDSAGVSVGLGGVELHYAVMDETDMVVDEAARELFRLLTSIEDENVGLGNCGGLATRSTWDKIGNDVGLEIRCERQVFDMWNS
jgi:hypothetical protein